VAQTVEALRDQVRQGDDLARLAWADLCEEQGDLEAAQALRALPGLAEEMVTQRRAVATTARAAPNLVLSLGGEWLWETPGAGRPRPSAALRVLMARGSEMRAALQWLAGRLGMGAVTFQLPSD